jgi:hypothetical protein
LVFLYQTSMCPEQEPKICRINQQKKIYMNSEKISNQEEPVFSRKVLEMLTVANEYCLFLEKAQDYPRESILSFLQKICPLIYIKASLLPDILNVNEDAAEHFVTEEEWESILTTIRTKLGKDELYLSLDPTNSSADPERANLAEAFADIYQDLKDFLMLYQKPQKASMEYAVYECKRLFETHFGYLLVNAHRVVHYLLYTDVAHEELEDIWDV